jgi:hypothetical protein
MPKGRRTINRDSVFRATGGTRQEKPEQGISDPVQARQTAVWLSDEELEWLDNHCQQIRRSGWRGITRSALLRALIQAAMERPIDLSGASGEVELKQRLAAQ